MDYTFNMFKKIGTYTYDKSVKAKDFVVEKAQDENFRKSIKEGVGVGIEKLKNMTTSTIDYVKDPNLKDNLKNDVSKGIDYSKRKTIDGYNTLKNPEFYSKLKNNISETYVKAEKNIQEGKEYFDNYIVIDFKNLKPNQIEYLVNLSDNEINRRFEEDEIILIYKLKKEYKEKEEEERLEEEKNKNAENLENNNEDSLQKEEERNENIELEI